MAYIYQADIFCDDCGERICEELKAEGTVPENTDDEWSYDSDDYPKHCADDEAHDSPQHCGCGERCLNAITLPEGKIGALFGDLTSDGVLYLKDAIEDLKDEKCTWCRSVVELWQEFYRDYL